MIENSRSYPQANGRFNSLLDRWGIPAPLFLGYVGLLLFMIGDGVESGYIATFISKSGAGGELHASYIITAYGLTVMLASWLSGALSELWGPRRVMILGLVIWLVFGGLFLAVAVPAKSYGLMLFFYGIRGFGYPMFAYAFLVWVTAVAPRARLGAAVGWFYFAFTGGLPTLGALTAAFSIPLLGQYMTLWVGFSLLAAGGLIAIFGVNEPMGRAPLAKPGSKPLQSLLSSVSLAWQMPKVGLGMLARMINTIPMFGFLVFFPKIFSDDIGFGEDRWLLLLSTIFGTCIFANLISGIISDRIGWRNTVFWFGSVGCSISILLLYFVPITFGAQAYGLALLVGALYGVTMAGWVPISALVPSLAPEHKGSAMALLNLGAGASAFVGPAIVSLLLEPLGPTGVVIIFSGLYLCSAVMVWFMKLPEGSTKSAMSPVASGI